MPTHAACLFEVLLLCLSPYELQNTVHPANHEVVHSLYRMLSGVSLVIELAHVVETFLVLTCLKLSFVYTPDYHAMTRCLLTISIVRQ